jgi:hypothetical protein
MEKNLEEWDFIIWASAFYLTEHLPEDSLTWEEKKLDKFLEDHAWEPFEYYSANQIWENIESLADAISKDFIWGPGFKKE